MLAFVTRGVNWRWHRVGTGNDLTTSALVLALTSASIGLSRPQMFCFYVLRFTLFRTGQYLIVWIEDGGYYEPVALNAGRDNGCNMFCRYKLAFLSVCSVAFFLPASLLNAVVVSTTVENTTAPPDDPGWANIAKVGGSTGIYLGNRWMLTADHIGASDAVFPDLGRFEANLATQVQIQNPGVGLTQYTDLLLYQLHEDPGLPPIKLATSTPKPSTEVIVAGNGRDRAAEPTYWHAVQDGEDVIWEVTDEPNSNYVGYRTENNNTIRWGTNLVEGDNLLESGADVNNTITITIEGVDVITTITEFDLKDSLANERIKGPDREPTTPFESQAALNDSGGGMFVKEDGEWVLAGVILAVSGFADQPDASITSIHGNATFYADIPSYRDQILGSLQIRGDFNSDGLLTASDIDLLANALGTDDLTFDINDDQRVDVEDHRFWVEDLRFTYFGDANLDGEFNTTDMVSAFRSALYETGKPALWESGDWNGDALFNSRDFVIALQSASFEKGPRTAQVPLQHVPEPNCISVFGLFVVAIVSLRNRRA